jgi:hypothetical protein
MPLTSMYLPGGLIANGYMVMGTPANTTGRVTFVSSTSANCQDDPSHGTSPDRPFATLSYAMSRTVAARGDTIMLMPDHAETITGVGGLTASTAGITVVGMGTYNQRARFLMDGGTTVTFAVTAADFTIRNVVFAAGHADIVACFVITAAGCTIEGCEFVNHVVDENFLTPIKATSTTDNNADGLRVIGCRFLTVDAATLEFIELNADVHGLVAVGNLTVSEGTACPLVLCATGKDLQQCLIVGNYTSNKASSGNLFLSNDTASPNNSGIVAHNRCGHADTTTSHTMGAVGGCRFFDNLSASTDAVSGFVLPAIDVDN